MMEGTPERLEKEQEAAMHQKAATDILDGYLKSSNKSGSTDQPATPIERAEFLSQLKSINPKISVDLNRQYTKKELDNIVADAQKDAARTKPGLLGGVKESPVDRTSRAYLMAQEYYKNGTNGSDELSKQIEEIRANKSHTEQEKIDRISQLITSGNI